MDILVLGSNGQVGRELVALLESRGASISDSLRVIPFTRDDLDLSDLEGINGTIGRKNPSLIINAAAYTAVDKAESDHVRAFRINKDAIVKLAEYCLDKSIPLVHISTDYVFGGEGFEPRDECAAVDPRSVYGRSKLAGEQVIRDLLPNHIILRTSWVFSMHGNNFVKTMLMLAEGQNDVRVVCDQCGGPTSARAIADTILEIISDLVNSANTDHRWGTYHFSGWPFVSWAEFASEIFHQATSKGLLRKIPAVKPITTSDYPTPAARPANSRLDCTKLKNTFGIEPDDWKRSLGSMLDEFKEEI